VIAASVVGPCDVPLAVTVRGVGCPAVAGPGRAAGVALLLPAHPASRHAPIRYRTQATVPAEVVERLHPRREGGARASEHSRDFLVRPASGSWSGSFEDARDLHGLPGGDFDSVEHKLPVGSAKGMDARLTLLPREKREAPRLVSRLCSTWELITPAATAATATTGSYAWTVSAPQTERARIRVTWTGGTANDKSDVNFKIR